MTDRLKTDQVVDSVIGGASPAERAAFEAARRNDPGLELAAARLEAQFAPLTAAARPLSPPEGLFDRIAAALESDLEAHEDTFDEPLEGGEWTPLAEGIEIKQLWDKKTHLLRCAPGAVLAPHPHVATEHTIVISGDMIIGARTYRPGDYHRATTRRPHAPITTRGGCIILVRYQPLPSSP